MVYQCTAGLWHVAEQLLLPLPPIRGADSAGYLAEVEQLLVIAIRAQGAGRVFPAHSVLHDRYRVGSGWYERLRLRLVQQGLLRQVGSLYLTAVPGVLTLDDD